ncbi:DUF2577 domain-containing protein [Agrilactobacillus fermenti]|uniref:DUF2577 domain-containing protein n=1 Tax=Agrilactobacillus fermenti TaxID=2586909 RepID=UPI003A5BEE5E
MMNAKGGNDSDYADFMFGKVISVDPLKIQLSNQMVLTDSFLTLGRQVTKHKERVTYQDMTHDGDTTRTETVIIDQALKTGDSVLMFRSNNGQRFYVLERLAEGVTG